MTPLDEFWASVLSGTSGASGAFSYCTADFASECNTNIGGKDIGRNGFYAPLAPLAPLASSDCPDDYARLERLAIQAEPDLGGSESADVPGFDDLVPVTMAQRRFITARLYGWAYPEEIRS